MNADWDLYRYGQWDAKSGRSQRGEVLASVLVERNRIAQGKVGLTSSAQMNSEDVVEGRIEREVADRFAGRVEDALAEGQLREQTPGIRREQGQHVVRLEPAAIHRAYNVSYHSIKRHLDSSDRVGLTSN